MNKITLERAMVMLIIAAGVLLSVIQYLYNRSLWGDEAAIALNIVNKSHLELLKPLDFNQVAPVLFLQIEKLFSELIPNSEFGLRLYPLLSFLMALFLFYRLTREIYQNSYTIVFALSLFVFNATLIYYSSEVKQYMNDLLVLTAVYFFIFKKYDNENNKYYWLTFAGALGIFLSNITPVILLAAGSYLVVESLRDSNKDLKKIIIMGVFWMASFASYFMLFIHNHPTRDSMLTFWADSFMPLNPLSAPFYKFLFVKFQMVFTSLIKFGIIGEIFLLGLAVIGTVRLMKKKRLDLFMLIILPVLIHLLLSGFKLYPFYLRFLLYTCPVIIMLISFGFDSFIKVSLSLLKIKNFRFLYILMPLIFGAYFFAHSFPVIIGFNELKDNIKFIEQHMDKNDKVYVDQYSEKSFLYYHDISFMNIADTNIVLNKGAKEYHGIKPFESGILKGHVWFLFKVALYEDEVKNSINYYASKGEKVIREFKTGNSEVYLFSEPVIQ